MVQTRRQWRQWEQEGFPEEQEQCEECQQENNYDFENDSIFNDPEPAGPSTYRSDPCNRHRPRDEEPYIMQVSSYTRRRPRS